MKNCFHAGDFCAIRVPDWICSVFYFGNSEVFLNQDEPLVSVVMAAYNAGKTIVSSVRSLLAQSYRNWELVVVDDKSTDNTAALIAELAGSDSRIRPIFLSENSGGPAFPRNEAIRASRGSYISFLDADDQWLPAKLERQLKFMLEVGAVLSCTGYCVVDANGAVVGGYEPPAVCSYKGLLSNNSIGCLTSMYDARALGKRYFPLCGHEDYALWLSILREGHIVHGLQIHLASYRLVPGSVSSNKFKVIGFFWHIYRNIEGFSYLPAAFFCLRYAWNARGKYKNQMDVWQG